MSDRPVTDGRAAPRNRSRRSAESARPLAHVLQRPSIGIDIGGTKVAAGVVDVDGHILERARRDTPDKSKSPRIVEDTIVEVVLELASRHDIVAVGIGAAGFVDAARSTVLFAPHLSWRHEPLRDAVHQRLRVPVVVENDANAALWAESRFGCGRGEDDLVCVNLGTGIGGSIMIDGVLRRGKYGVAGEFGHMQVVPGGHRCECGNRGCWEQYASGNALVREARELAMADSPVAQGLLDRVDRDPAKLTGPIIAAAATAGDPAAIELFEEVGRWLGIGLANLAAALDPGAFIIGGGVSEAGDVLIEPARDAYRKQLTGRGFRPAVPIMLAQLGNDAGLIGAADLARERTRLFRRRKARRPRRKGMIGR